MAKKMQYNIASLEDENKLLRSKLESLEKKLAMSNTAFLNIVGKSQDGIVIIDQQQMVVYTNYAAMSLFDRNIADLLGEPLHLSCGNQKLFENTENATEIKIPKADGSHVIAEVSVLPTEWNNESCFVVCFRDITERKNTEEILDYMSKHDYLTDLPNRVLFEKKLSMAIDDAKQHDEYMALMYVDLDNFKMVNDTLGHNAGDLLLKEISRILTSQVRSTDTVARLGGDEFAIVLERLHQPEDAASIAENILNQLGKVLVLDGHELYANASIGIAVYPYAATQGSELIQSADTAMYEAKKRGKNQYRFFTEHLNKTNNEDMQLSRAIRTMVSNDELFIEYQPIIDVKTESCAGIESLIRWQHPKLGLIYPDVFLPYAEEAKLMPEVGLWVVKHALEDFKKISNNMLSFVSINMSATEVDGANIVENILGIINNVDVNPEELVLELTETSVMQNPEASIQKFQQLSDIGVLIAVDDFGTGYSSLNYLRKLPLYILKIDKSFVDDIGSDDNDEVIIKSTIQLAHNLGLKVIAEGVETQEQFEFLKALKCDYVQGYYFSRPIKFDALQVYLAESKLNK